MTNMNVKMAHVCGFIMRIIMMRNMDYDFIGDTKLMLIMITI